MALRNTKMAGEDNNRARVVDLVLGKFVLPLLVGACMLVAGYLIRPWLEPGRRISYTIQGPTQYFQKIGTNVVEFNGTPVENLYGYKVHWKNSGSEPVTDMEVLYEFEGNPKSKIVNMVHSTRPEKQFGSVSFRASEQSVTFSYNAFNTGNEAETTLIVTDPATLKVYANPLGTTVVQEEAEQSILIRTSRFELYAMTTLFALTVFNFGSMSSSLLKDIRLIRERFFRK